MASTTLQKSRLPIPFDFNIAAAERRYQDNTMAEYFWHTMALLRLQGHITTTQNKTVLHTRVILDQIKTLQSEKNHSLLARNAHAEESSSYVKGPTNTFLPSLTVYIRACKQWKEQLLTRKRSVENNLRLEKMTLVSRKIELGYALLAHDSNIEEREINKNCAEEWILMELQVEFTAFTLSSIRQKKLILLCLEKSLESFSSVVDDNIEITLPVSKMVERLDGGTHIEMSIASKIRYGEALIPSIIILGMAQAIRDMDLYSSIGIANVMGELPSVQSLTRANEFEETRHVLEISQIDYDDKVQLVLEMEHELGDITAQEAASEVISKDNRNRRSTFHLVSDLNRIY